MYLLLSQLCSIITCSRKEFDMCKNEVYCATKFALSFINDRLFPCTVSHLMPGTKEEQNPKVSYYL